MTYRDIMRNNDENMSWCSPISLDNGKVIIAENETKIVGIQVDGVDIDITPESIKAVAKRVNDEYDEYRGWSDRHIIFDAEHHDLPCRLCPWFEECQALDGDVEEYEEYPED